MRSSRNEAKAGSSVRTVALAVLAAGIGLAPVGVAAQGLSGVALGPDGQPLAEHTIILHRVGAGGGAMAGSDTTNADGEFVFTLDGDPQSAYFAALRYDGELYIGPAVDGSQSITDYVLEVMPAAAIGAIGGAAGGGIPTARTPQAMPPASGGSSDVGALWLVGLLALAAAVTFVVTAPRYRRRRTRDALVEIASLENQLAAGQLEDGERDGLRARRDRLKEQLAPPG